MINFLDPNEAPTIPSVLQRMSEDGHCLLTGEKDKLTYFPVDTNPQNFLPSNMSCITDAIAKEVSYTFCYELKLWGYTLTMDTPPVFKPYNESVVEIISTLHMCEQDTFKTAGPANEKFTDFYEYLTKHHLKGLAKITFGTESLDANQYQGYLLRILAETKAQAPKSKIITSPNLGIVKP